MASFVIFMDRKIQYCKDVNFSQFIYVVKTIPIKISELLFFNYWKIVSQVYIKRQKILNNQHDIEGKNKVRRFILSNFKTCKATVINIV